MSQRHKHHLHALASRKFHRRNEVTVPCDENDRLDLGFQSERGNIEPEPHVDTLLMDVGFDIPGMECDARRPKRQLASANSPAAKCQVSAANGDEWKHAQVLEELRICASEAGCSEIHLSTQQRLRGFHEQWRRVVPIDAMQSHSVQSRMRANGADERAHIVDIQGMQR
jgi:hypothetical protein